MGFNQRRFIMTKKIIIMLLALFLCIGISSIGFSVPTGLPDLPPYDPTPDQVKSLQAQVASLQAEVAALNEAVLGLQDATNDIRAVLVIMARANSFDEARRLVRDKLGIVDPMRLMGVNNEGDFLRMYNNKKNNIAQAQRAAQFNKQKAIELKKRYMQLK